MRVNKPIIFLTLVGMIILVVFNGHAANFCVNSVFDLKNALLAASLNGEDDVIKIESGEYIGSGDPAFQFIAEENKSLHISGGWNEFNGFGCFQKLGKPIDTILKRDTPAQILDISLNVLNFDSEISISNLSIFNGLNAAVQGASALGIDVNGSDAVIDINQLLIFSNSSSSGSAVKINGGYQTTIKNSVFEGNNASTSLGIALIAMDEFARGFYFINNTIFTGYNGGISGLNVVLGEGAQAMIVNNLFWQEMITGDQINLSTDGTSYLYNNSFCSLGGVADFESGNICTVEFPLTPSPFNYTPDISSPLVNQGLPAPESPPIPVPFELDWDYGVEDYDRGIIGRVAGGRVDIGAVEAPPEVPIFKNGFE